MAKTRCAAACSAWPTTWRGWPRTASQWTSDGSWCASSSSAPATAARSPALRRTGPAARTTRSSPGTTPSTPSRDGARLFSEYLAELTAEAARGFATFAARRQLDAGILDFDDLLGRARDLLAGRTAPPAEARRVREHFQNKYRYLLVDEFQDTDPLQVEIVFLLAAEDPDDDGWATARLAPGKLFLVGDPKQSIYRFRDADIAIFQRVKELVRSQGDVLEIWQNFRTVPGVVEWVNDAFREIIGDVDEELRPAYRAIEAWREEPDPDQPKVCALRPECPLQEWKAEEVRSVEAETLAAFLSGVRRPRVDGRRRPRAARRASGTSRSSCARSPASSTTSAHCATPGSLIASRAAGASSSVPRSSTPWPA